MKIIKRRTPELLAGVLFLSIFFVPCAGVHAEDFSAEQKDSIRSVVTEAINGAGVVKKSELDSSVKKAVTEANKNSGTQTSLSAEKVKEIVKESVEQNVPKKIATKDDLGSVKTPAWIIGGVIGLLVLACLGLLIVLLVRKPKKTDDEAEKAKRNAERDSYFNSLFASVNANTDEKIQKLQASIGAIKAPPTTTEISVAVNNAVKPRIDELAGKIGGIKMPKSEDIATEVFGAVTKDIENMKKVLGDTKSYLEETKKVIGGVNQEYGGALKLLEKIQDDQKKHLEKMETDRKVFKQETQKEQAALDERRKGLDAREAGLVKRDAELVQGNAALARQKDDLVAKEKGLEEGKKKLEEEKKGLDAKIKQAVDSARLECRSQFDKEKAALEQKSAQEKAALEQKSAQEKAALEAKLEQEKKDHATTRTEKDGLAAKLEQEKKDHATTRTEKDGLAAKNGELQKKVDGHDREIESYTNQLKTKNEEIGKLKGANDALDIERKKLFEDNQKLSAKLKEKDGEISKLNEENKKIWDEAKAKYEPELQRLKTENEGLSKELEFEKRNNQELQNRVAGFEAKTQMLQQELEKLAKLLEEAQRRGEEMEVERRHLEQEIEHLKMEKEHLQTELASARASIQKTEKIIYPEEFKSDPKFAVLKQHLDDWIDIPESAIVRASLQLFSQRGTIKKEDTLTLALRDLSFGITQTLSRKNVPPNEIIAELVSWCDFLQGYSDDTFRFNLQVPGLGENYDSTRMTTTKSTDRVHKVLTWMVLIHRKNAIPIKKLAEVE